MTTIPGPAPDPGLVHLTPRSWLRHVRGWATQPDLTQIALEQELDWQHQELRMFGKTVHQPRLTAVCGRSMDPASHYRRPNPEHPWSPTADRVRQQVLTEAPGWHPNGLIANLYRTGADSVAWHADDEPALGPTPVVASVSFGATRRFQLRARDGTSRHALDLRHGDLLVMGGATQGEFLHAITKTTKVDSPRLSLTFRQYYGPQTEADVHH